MKQKTKKEPDKNINEFLKARKINNEEYLPANIFSVILFIISLGFFYMFFAYNQFYIAGGIFFFVLAYLYETNKLQRLT